jgi:trehalose 6-phosphate synthase/phosphatase
MFSWAVSKFHLFVFSGRACIYILRALYGNNWPQSVKVIYAGDDVTDENAFRALSGLAVTFRVAADASVVSEASHRLSSVSAVEALLRFIVRKLSQAAAPVGQVMGG